MVAEKKFFNTRDKEFLNWKWDMFWGKGCWHVYLHLKFVSKMSHLKSVCFKTIEQWIYGCLGYIIGIELPCSLRLRIIFDHVSLLKRPAIHGKDSLKGCKASILEPEVFNPPPIFEEWSTRWQLDVSFWLVHHAEERWHLFSIHGSISKWSFLKFRKTSGALNKFFFPAALQSLPI